MVNKEKLIIISQNFKGNINYKKGENRLENKNKNKTAVVNYLKHYDADIVAGQELPAHINEKEFIEANKLIGSFDGQAEGQSQFFTGFYVNNNKNYKMGLNSNKEISEIWEKLFIGCPGYSFKSGYWAEKWIKFCDERIRIINLHISATYAIQLRVSLLKYLSQIQNPYTIILGDFNAAKKDQTVKNYEENHVFLKMIEANKYIELIDDFEENGICHHTYYLTSRGRKLDHIFVSKAFNDKFRYEIEYIDEVNETHPDYQHCNQTFTDHSGIKVCFYEKNYDTHNKKGVGIL
ncbi:MAG: endonuclease/exonuclease/phosphatase family metal-dependent hydrolase [Clostridium sp.]|jgi:endonuclease/exonuclease/phosphatase family metal-dependent hydrolase